MSDLLHVSATGSVVTGNSRLQSVTLTAGADAATATIRSNGASGIVRLVLAAAAGTSASWRSGDPVGANAETSLHVTLTGTSPTVDVEVTR